MKTYRLQNLEETRALARRIVDRAQGRSLTLGLTGDLGTGKTTLVRMVVEQLAERSAKPSPRVISPTFVLHQAYEELTPPVEHFDLYRLERPGRDSLMDIGYFEALDRTRDRCGLLFVEWPERAESTSHLGLDGTLSLYIEGQGRRATLELA